MNNPKLAQFSEAELLAELLYRAMDRARQPIQQTINATDTSLIDMVDEFIENSSYTFTVRDVETYLKDTYGEEAKRASITGYLSQRKSVGILKKIGTQFVRA